MWFDALSEIGAFLGGLGALLGTIVIFKKTFSVSNFI